MGHSLKMTDFKQQRSRKMKEIKQELSDGEENEAELVSSVTSPNHFNSQFVIKQEESSSIQAEEDSVHLNKITSITCQVKTEPESEKEEDGCGLETIAGDYPVSYVIKREIIEVHPEDHPMKDNKENHKKTTEDEDAGTEANHITKSENDNWSPNFPDNNIDEENNISDLSKEMKKQHIYGRIVKETEMSLTQAKTLCQTTKNHKCSMCSEAFQSNQACLWHMWKTHTRENPYMCEVCGKSFKYLRNLQIHKAVHSDERPYSCDLCQKTFKLKGVLQRHNVLCHSIKRPYSCDLCEKAFKCNRDLQNHKMSCHSDERPYSCDLCKKTFKLKCALQNHKTFVHSDERPYSCDLCKKTFKLMGTLKTHKISCHSDERPYSCDVCNNTFKLKGLCDRHKRTIHSDEKRCPEMYVKRDFKRQNNLQYHLEATHLNNGHVCCYLLKSNSNVNNPIMIFH